MGHKIFSDDAIRTAITNGMTAIQIADSLSVTAGAVRKRIKLLGLNLKQQIPVVDFIPKAETINKMKSILSLYSKEYNTHDIAKQLSVSRNYIYYILRTFQIAKDNIINREFILSDILQGKSFGTIAVKYFVDTNKIRSIYYQYYYRDDVELQQLIRAANIAYGKQNRPSFIVELPWSESFVLA